MIEALEGTKRYLITRTTIDEPDFRSPSITNFAGPSRTISEVHFAFLWMVGTAFEGVICAETPLVG